jgi:serine/threonine protein kinase
MQHLEKWLKTEFAQQQQRDQLQRQQQQHLMNMHQLNGMNLGYIGMANGNTMNYQDFSNVPFNRPPQPQRQGPRNMLEAHVMTALDSMTDGRSLYCVMPYCSGGELFDVLEKKTKFSEAEARFWMRQILQVSVFKR